MCWFFLWTLHIVLPTRRASTGQRAPKYLTPRRPTCTDGILEVCGASVDAQSALKRASASLQKQLICVQSYHEYLAL